MCQPCSKASDVFSFGEAAAASAGARQAACFLVTCCNLLVLWHCQLWPCILTFSWLLKMGALVGWSVP